MRCKVCGAPRCLRCDEWLADVETLLTVLREAKATLEDITEDCRGLDVGSRGLADALLNGMAICAELRVRRIDDAMRAVVRSSRRPESL